MESSNKGTTKTGFKYSINEKATKDWRFISLTKKMNKGNPVEQFDALDEALNMILGGEEEKERLLQHVESMNDGYAPIEKVIDEFNEILESVKN